MITTINKNLFEVEHGYYLAHCISSDFTLGAGIAKQFNEKYDMINKLNHLYLECAYDYGGYALVVDDVFNLVIKNSYKDNATFESIESALIDMRKQANNLFVTKIAMPKIASGHEGLNWDDVYNLIVKVFANSGIDIVICCFDKSNNEDNNKNNNNEYGKNNKNNKNNDNDDNINIEDYLWIR